MATRKPVKRFAEGQAVEIQRETLRPWEPATYIKKVTGWRGWHTVRTPIARYVNSMSGMETCADDPQMFVTYTLSVPTQRIRAR